MREKVLKSMTIIPDNLYVERNADRQLEANLRDMGRPCCILVARQMGKTNLLLRTKRKLESQNDVFVYVDLSTYHDTAQECFRNIIDVAIELNEELFAQVGEQIYQRRSQNHFSAVKEHEKELLMLLKATKGKIVISLDEIDGLVGVPYSDKIFAQIRSVYFAGRTNHPNEFGRLTYVMAGVLEPTQIIKNKKISPFNIADNILLSDFSKEEFLIFLKKAELHFSKEVSDRIYSWTNGNPRMTWDICSIIEDKILESKAVTQKDVDLVVRQTYLTNYDKPPIDHIRELVEKYKDVRDAVKFLMRNKSEIISDAMKKQLYLYGITGVKIDSNESLSIKNQIIEECMSLDWIESIERQGKSLVVLAQESLENKNYQKTIELIIYVAHCLPKQVHYLSTNL